MQGRKIEFIYLQYFTESHDRFTVLTSMVVRYPVSVLSDVRFLYSAEQPLISFFFARCPHGDSSCCWIAQESLQKPTGSDSGLQLLGTSRATCS